MNNLYWVCQRCNHQEPVSKYKQSPTRYCPKCFAANKSQIPMRQRESKARMPTRTWNQNQ